jgi:hypothetical protein
MQIAAELKLKVKSNRISRGMIGACKDRAEVQDHPIKMRSHLTEKLSLRT